MCVNYPAELTYKCYWTDGRADSVNQIMSPSYNVTLAQPSPHIQPPIYESGEEEQLKRKEDPRDDLTRDSRDQATRWALRTGLVDCGNLVFRERSYSAQ